MKLGSLCSGAAGLDMAVEAAFNATTAWHCEYDPAATKVLAHRYPGTPNHSDLTTTNWTQVEPIDILCAGWPCQPFSLAGRQKGAADERAIWPQIADAIRILRPRIVVLENVSAVLRHEFGRVADSLAQLGYDLRWRCVRASDVGAPHRRERLFVIAHAAGVPWSVGHGNDVRLGSGAGRHAQTAGRSGDAADAAGGGGSHQSQRGGTARLDVCPIPRTGSGNHAGGVAAGIRQLGGTPTQLATAVTLLPTPKASDGVWATPRTSGRPIEAATHLQTIATLTSTWGKYAAAITRWEMATRPAPAPTEPNKNGNPRLSAAFSEWMMGWPQGWVTHVPGISRNDQLRIIGNGVVPQAAHHAIQTLLNVAGAA